MASSKHLILENARRLFSENGFKGTTIAQIAKTSNVTDAAIYRHYRSKQQIFDSIINDFFDEFSGLMDSIHERQKSGYCLIETLILDLDAFLDERVVELKVIMNTYTIMPSARQIMERMYALLGLTLERCLEKGMRDGTVRDDLDITPTASLIAVMLMGMSRRQLYWPETPNLAQEAITFCQRSIRSL
jgi:AcrR family transcriptional regulator